MGKIIEILGSKKINPISYFLSKRLVTEENKQERSIHIHLRNKRLEFTKEEFIDFAEHIKKSLDILKEQRGINADDSRDGGSNNYYILEQKKVNESPGFKKDLLQIELNEPNVIHVHYRNLRIDLSPDEFVEIAEVFHTALMRIKKTK